MTQLLLPVRSQLPSGSVKVAWGGFALFTVRNLQHDTYIQPSVGSGAGQFLVLRSHNQTDAVEAASFPSINVLLQVFVSPLTSSLVVFRFWLKRRDSLPHFLKMAFFIVKSNRL